jgi:hypothetical protein
MMSDKKISQLTAATIPLVGTDVLPIVQSGATVKASIANVQAAPVAAGTADGVQYLNATKVPTTGTALKFDGIDRFTIGNGTTGYIMTAGGESLIGYSAGAVYISYGFGVNPPAAINMGNIQTASQNYRVAFNGSYIWNINGVRMSLSSTGNLTLNTGNLVIGTAGKGIDFSASGGGTLAYYEKYIAPSTACTGAITTAVSWKVAKVGDAVTLTLPTTTGIAVAVPGLFFRYGHVLPAQFRPAADTGFPCCIKDVSANLDVPGLIYVSASTGNITVYKNLAITSNFTFGGTSGLGQGVAASVSWII